MMKGYLTIFLSLSLSILAGFIFLLTGHAIRNAEKVRYECAVDTGMNAVLSEYHRELFERYGLLYVDASYLEKEPSISHVENRLWYYIEENTSGVLTGKKAPWGNLALKEVSIPYFETAAAELGSSMRNQAVCYAEDMNISGREGDVISQMQEIHLLDDRLPMSEWIAIMEELAGMELPWILNEKGERQEVSLSNPADWVYGLAGSDVLYLAEADLQSINPAAISLEEYISHRQPENVDSTGRKFRKEEDLFLSYLFDRMGYLGKPQDDSLLLCQLEYIAEGRASDLENVRNVAKRLFQWRFADNVRCALNDGDLWGQAVGAAERLHAVQLKEAFKDPVAKSILYACAFLESVGDIRKIYRGESVPLRKSHHNMSVDYVLGNRFYNVQDGQGWFYEQYLAAMILLAEEKTINLRAMDIMEMDIRFHDGNHNFKMDWCIERYEANVAAQGGFRGVYKLRRKYGYF